VISESDALVAGIVEPCVDSVGIVFWEGDESRKYEQGRCFARRTGQGLGIPADTNGCVDHALIVFAWCFSVLQQAIGLHITSPVHQAA